MHCIPSDPKEFYQEHMLNLTADIVHSTGPQDTLDCTTEQRLLFKLSSIDTSYSRSTANFGLPVVDAFPRAHLEAQIFVNPGEINLML